MKPTDPNSWSRRSFLRRTSAAATCAGLPLWFLEREAAHAADATPAPRGPNDRPGIALIGCGGMGTGDAIDAQRFGDIVAVCDVDENHLAAARARFTHNGRTPAAYKDFRALLANKDVHAVINATPDHWHSLVNIAAARAGKDIYSEKPLTLTIGDGRRVIEAARRHRVVLQTGTQQRSSQRFRLACELVRNQRIGTLKEITVWLPAGLREGPFATCPVPAGLDWDFWQGPAAATDYLPQRCHMMFRYWNEYSGGTITDWGAHHLDIARWALRDSAPTRVEGKVLSPPIPGGYTAASEYDMTMHFAEGPTLRIRSTPDDSPFGAVIHPAGQRNGIRFEGTDGWIWVNRDQLEADDRERLRQEPGSDGERLPVSNDHKGNFFECMRTRQDPICNVETGHLSATLGHLGKIALELGVPLDWDSKAERFTGDHAAQANERIDRPMRKPYDLSFVA